MNYEMRRILLQKQHVILIRSAVAEFHGLEYHGSYVLWAHSCLELPPDVPPLSLQATPELFSYKATILLHPSQSLGHFNLASASATTIQTKYPCSHH